VIRAAILALAMSALLWAFSGAESNIEFMTDCMADGQITLEECKSLWEARQ
jgi:hypothetical protein